MSGKETEARFIRGERVSEALRHLNAGKKIRVTLSNGEIAELQSGNAGIAEAVNILLGQNEECVVRIELMDEPAAEAGAN